MPPVRQPAFAPAACQAGTGAIFAFPLRIGAIRAGAMGLYRERPGPLSPARLGDALIFADTATLLLLDAQTRRRAAPLQGPGPGGQPPDPTPHRAEIDQAKGKLAERLGVDMNQAFRLLREYARSRNLRLSDLAQAFIDGSQPSPA